MNAFSVAFGGKADMPVAGSPLSRSLLGVKRTSGNPGLKTRGFSHLGRGEIAAGMIDV